MNKYIFLTIGIIFLAIAGVYILGNKNNQQIKAPVINNQIAQTPLHSLTPIITSTPSPSFSPNIAATIAYSGPTRGQIICDYKVPSAPNMQGLADINSNWNGSTSIQICVSANGNNQTLIASDNNTNGTRGDTVNWISSNVEYIFTLYNHHSGDPVCSGAVLSSCQLGSK